MLSKARLGQVNFNAYFLCAAIILGTMVQFVFAATQGFEAIHAQLVKSFSHGGERNLNISGMVKVLLLIHGISNGSTNERWRSDYKQRVFKIVNVTYRQAGIS